MQIPGYLQPPGATPCDRCLRLEDVVSDYQARLKRLEEKHEHTAQANTRLNKELGRCRHVLARMRGAPVA